MSRAFFFTLLCAAALAWSPARGIPGDVLFEDDFEDGTLASWTATTVTSPVRAGVGTYTAQSGTRSLYVRGGGVGADSPAIDASGIAGADLSLWVRRGSDAFSEDPEQTDEDGVLLYLDDVGVWRELDRWEGGQTPGEVFTPTYSLPANALHAGLRLRVLLPAGDDCDNTSGPGAPCWDYYHFDDVRLVERGPPITANLVLEYRMEDGAWDGTAGEVTDASGNGLDATSFGGATLDDVDPAIAGDPGTCVYGIFDGVNDYLEVADDPSLDLATALTVTAWIHPRSLPGSGLMSVLSKDENFEFHVNPSGEIFWWWGGGTQELTSAGANITVDRWRHVAVTYASGRQAIYVDGVIRATSTRTGTLTTNSDPFQVGQDQGFAGRFFDGYIDEVRIYDDLLSQAQVQDVMAQTHPCPLFCGSDAALGEGFEDGTLAPWTIDAGADGSAGVSTDTAGNGTRSMFLRHDTIAVRSPVVDLSAATDAGLSVWVRRGSDTFSENPDDDEDLVLEYLDDTSGWVTLQTFPGNGTQGEIFQPSYTLPAAAFHAGFQVRFRFLQGSGSDFDYWHVDDVCLTATIVVGVDHFEVSHDGYGIHCTGETIEVTAADAAGAAVTDYTGEIELDTGSGNGTWTAAAGNQGTFADATADDGLARYTFADADDGVASFVLAYTQGTTPIDVEVEDVADPSATDDDSEGLLAWAASGFTVTASALANPPPNPIVDPIANQVAGTDFALHLAAYGTTPTDPSCGIIETYTGLKGIAFWHGWLDPGSGPVVPTIDGNAIAANEAGAANQAVTFTNGQAVVTAKYKDVGRIQIAMKDASVPEPAGGIRGATNAFVVSPADFVVTAVQRPDLSANPGVSVPTGDVFVAAGAPFRVTVEARDAEGSLTPSYGNEAAAEGIVLTAPTLVAPAGGRNGSADDGAIGNGAAFAASGPAGTFLNTQASWDEVGAITLRAGVADGDYLGAGDVTGTASGTVGRFRPDHFDAAPNAPTFATACAAGGFTYLDQPFDFMVGGRPVLTVTAQAVANTTTRNYTGTWLRLTNGSLQNRTYAAATGTLDGSGLPATTVDPTIADGGDGTATLTFSAGSGLLFQRSATPVAPFAADVALSIDVLDLDGVAYASNPARFGQAAAGLGIPFDAGNAIRFGRLAFENAHGSELSALPVPLRAEQFVAAGYFAAHTDDACSVLGVGNLALTPTPGSLSTTPTIGNAPLAAGEAGLVLSAPGDGNTGTVDLGQDLSPSGDALPWLRFDWDQDGNHDDDPTGRATFGVFSGEGAVIFQREVY